ncbi:MAG: lipid-A-disaccharide synthase [Elusimicrobiota bacterium]|jgi:lipid-A-disaccharide synthase|nr:lipid-A-disaccharide synthase [Elusimicrobiota bacterium]
MNIFISAGDLSGDIHSAALIKEIKLLNPQAHISAIGGNKLKEISVDFLCDIVNINAFGFLPIKQIFFLKKVLNMLKEHFLKQKPDKIILTDYYGFHIRVAMLAKEMGIPVYYFISPQVWASRSGRIEKLAKVVKKMLVIFPFEEKLYRDKGLEAVFIGNPLIDKVPVKENFNISNPPLIGLFPGSRKDTIKRHLPVILSAARILKERINASFIMFSADESLKNKLPDFIKLETKNDFNIRKTIDIAICPSGTVSLENALMAIPMAVMYKLSYFNYFVIRALIKVKYITIANILVNKSIIPEFIQFNAKPEKIADYIVEQLKPENYSAKVKELLIIRDMLGEKGVCKRAAEIILE